MFILRTLFYLQLAVMLPIFGFFIGTPASLHTLRYLIVVVAVGVGVGLFTLWQMMRHPERRGLAVATLVTPLICGSTPFLMDSLGIEPVAPAVLIGLVTVAILIGSFLLLAHPAGWQPSGPLTSPTLNKRLLQAQVITLTLIWAPIIVWLATGQGQNMSLSSTGPSTQLGVALVYFVSVSAPAACITLFTLMYAPVGLVRNATGRLAHAGQLVCALLLTGSLGIIGIGVGIGMMNPG